MSTAGWGGGLVGWVAEGAASPVGGINWAADPGRPYKATSVRGGH